MKNSNKLTRLIVVLLFTLGLMQCSGGSSDNDTDVCDPEIVSGCDVSDDDPTVSTDTSNSDTISPDTGSTDTSSTDTGGSSAGVEIPDSVTFSGTEDTVSGLVGRSVSTTGDINNDGINDLVIGAAAAGKVYVIYGQSDYHENITLDQADVIFTEENSGDYAGYSLAIVSDMNGDNHDEILIGAHKYRNGRGKTYLIYGGNLSGTNSLSNVGSSVSGAYFVGENNDDYSGFSVANAGDVDGDGKGDFLIGAYRFSSGSSGQNRGRTYLIYGDTFRRSINELSNIETSFDGARFTGENGDDKSGFATAKAGDVNNDGCDDILIGTYSANKAYFYYGVCGAARLSGGQPLADAEHIFSDSEGSSFFGISISPAGDTNGDGYDDFLIGAQAASTDTSNVGKTYLIFGRSRMTSGENYISHLTSRNQAISFNGHETNSHSSLTLAGGGDYNGDGYADIAIGAFGTSDNSGAVYMHLLDDGHQNSYSNEAAAQSFIGEETEYLGIAGLALDSDINGDGYSDLVIGSPLATDDENNKIGKVYIHYGQP